MKIMWKIKDHDRACIQETYRRARAWPGRVRRASKGILHTSIQAAITQVCRLVPSDSILYSTLDFKTIL